MTAKQLLARYKYFVLATVVCVLTLCLGIFLRSDYHETKDPPTLAGKWVGTIVWNDASGRPYQQKMRTALFFLPHNVTGIVLTFPTGAIGGAGRYLLKGSHLTVRCTSLSVNGRPVPLSTFSSAPWYHSVAEYTVAYDSTNLRLTSAAEPAPAPCWPLLVTAKPLVLSRIAPPDETASAPAPRE